MQKINEILVSKRSGHVQDKKKDFNNVKEPRINLRSIIDKIEQEDELHKMKIAQKKYFDSYLEDEHDIDWKENFNAEFMLKEDEEVYIQKDLNVQHSNDKIMRAILKNRSQVAIALNKWLDIKVEYQIKENEIEEVTENYITKNWDDRTTDIVYKDKKYDGVFYLIEHQTEVNYKMAQRIAEYKNEIRRNYQKNINLKNKKDYRVAKVIALVLYTGEKQWDAAKSIKELEAKCPRIKIEKTNDYKLISSKEFTIEELKEDSKKSEKDILSRIFLINKIGQLDNLNQVEKEINKLILLSNHMQYIAAYINNIVSQKYGKETAELMIKVIQEKINKEEKEKDGMLMEAFVDKFLEEGERRGEKRGKELGIAQGIKQVAINMLRQKYKKEDIKKCTGLSNEQIKKLEKTMLDKYLEPM